MSAPAPRLYVAVSAHGYGHMAQTGPVLEAWMQRFPGSRLYVSCDGPPAVLRRHLRVPFELLPGDGDIGMQMASALDVLPQASHRAYLDRHADWPGRVRGLARQMAAVRPDLVLSNVGYASLAAAAELGLPAAGLCSLNWADIYQAYCADLPGATGILETMRSAYASADLFLGPEPGMVADWMPGYHRIAPLARTGGGDRAGLRRRLGLGAGQRCVLIAAGGIELRLPVERWRDCVDVHWLVPGEWDAAGPAISPFSACGMDFREMMLSCDALLTKPGYGTFVDAVCNRLPLLYIERPGWPESPPLCRWAEARGRARRLPRAQALQGGFRADLTWLWQADPPQPPVPGGAEQAVAMLANLIAID